MTVCKICLQRRSTAQNIADSSRNLLFGIDRYLPRCLALTVQLIQLNYLKAVSLFNYYRTNTCILAVFTGKSRIRIRINICYLNILIHLLILFKVFLYCINNLTRGRIRIYRIYVQFGIHL